MVLTMIAGAEKAIAANPIVANQVAVINMAATKTVAIKMIAVTSTSEMRVRKMAKDEALNVLRRWKNLKNVGRLRKIVGVFARHGFQNVVVRAKFGRFVLDRFTPYHIERLSTPERLRMSFEQLGPTFVKLGQLLASRPDLIPLDWSEEFRKLHDQVAPEDRKSVV